MDALKPDVLFQASSLLNFSNHWENPGTPRIFSMADCRLHQPRCLIHMTSGGHITLTIWWRSWGLSDVMRITSWLDCTWLPTLSELKLCWQVAMHAYITLVRLGTEYVSIIGLLSPHARCDIDNLRKVRRTSARWIDGIFILDVYR